MDTERLPLFMLVEDSPADVKILQRALSQTSRPVELAVLRDGEEAADYLLHRGAFSDRRDCRLPDLIVLDLNLPRMTGLELLRLIRATPEIALIPVVILSTSRRPEDVRDAYAAGANTYVEKPLDFERFVVVIRTLQSLWLDMALLPAARG
jgi:two-component system response regulator